MDLPRQSAIFDLSDRYVAELAKLSPIAATYLGEAAFDNCLDDFSLDGYEEKAQLLNRTLVELSSMEASNDRDRVAKEVMQERMQAQVDIYATHEEQIRWNATWSPPLYIRQVFEMMPAETQDEIDCIYDRLCSVPTALQSWLSCIQNLSKRGEVNSLRQTASVANQLSTLAKGSFSGFARKIDPSNQFSKLHEAALRADRATGQTSKWLAEEYLPMADLNDRLGEERYSAWARYFTGSRLNLRATYEWGLDELARIENRMWQVAADIDPDTLSLRAVASHLDNDSGYWIEGTETLLERLRQFTQTTMDDIDGVLFDLDDRIRPIEIRLAPEGTAAAPYYEGPSEDLTRPGSTWFPVTNRSRFHWWRIPPMWYHESVPGHHMQVTTAIIQRNGLSRYQRTMDSFGGYCEGWALYAELLMNELGAYDDSGLDLGFLSAQAMRAARVVVDIGMHLSYSDRQGRMWNSHSAVNVLKELALLDDSYATSEVNRYLGMPGQAISYKVGERAWLSARSDVRRRLASHFSLKRFHHHALGLGPMGLDTFEQELGRWDGN